MCTSTRLQLAAWRVSGIRLKPFGRHFHLCLTARKVIILSLVEMDMLVPNKEYVSLSNTITPDYTGNPYLSFQRRKPPLHTNILQVCPLMQLLCPQLRNSQWDNIHSQEILSHRKVNLSTIHAQHGIGGHKEFLDVRSEFQYFTPFPDYQQIPTA